MASKITHVVLFFIHPVRLSSKPVTVTSKETFTRYLAKNSENLNRNIAKDTILYMIVSPVETAMKWLIRSVYAYV